MAEITFEASDDKLSVEGLDDGRHVVKETPGGTKIVAYVSDGKASRYEAEDPAGERQQLFVMRPDSADPQISPDGTCLICRYEPAFNSVFCYTVIECPPFVGPEPLGPH